MTTISQKKRYYRIDGWRGYLEPVNAVCGVSDNGNDPYAPAPHQDAMNELRMAQKALRDAGIRYRTVVDQSSNVFMIKRHVLVAPDDRARAKELIEPLYRQTRILHPAGD